MVRILVDSASDYMQEDLEAKGIELIPMKITIGDQTFSDKTKDSRDKFYEILEQTNDFPKTSQPSPQEYLDIFEDVKAKGDEMVVITLSSAMSGTYQSAVLAKEMAEYDKIYIVDSRMATYTIKILGDYACRLRVGGKSAAQIAEAVTNLRRRVKCYAGLDTLEFLQRGGRIGKAAAMIGNLARLKPQITFLEDGTISIIGKAIGIKKSISSLAELVLTKQLDTSFPIYPIFTYGTENTNRFKAILEAGGVKFDELLQVGATIGTHIGPEAFGVILVEK